MNLKQWFDSDFLKNPYEGKEFSVRSCEVWQEARLQAIKQIGEKAWKKCKSFIDLLWFDYFGGYTGETELTFFDVEEFVNDNKDNELLTDHDWLVYFFIDSWEESLACLGEEEIKNRLKEVSK